jgi:hypothetical protein
MLGTSVRYEMSNAFHKRIRDWRFITPLAIGLIAGYAASVGIVPAVLRHTGDSGRLQWLPSVPGAVKLLQAYAWPAQQLSRVRVLHSVFEFSASFWWNLLDPPDTTA